MNKGFFGMMLNNGWFEKDGTLNHSVSVPFGTLRAWNSGASFEYIGANGQNWQGFDQIVSYCAREHKRLLFCMAGEVGTRIPPIADWASYLDRILTRAYEQIDIIEPWNEPVYSGEGPLEILGLARNTYAIVKERHPGIYVLTPSLSAFKPYEKDYSSVYLAAMGDRPGADAIAFHGYCDNAGQLKEIITWFKQRTHLPLYCTEFSLLGNDPAGNLKEAYRILAKEGVKGGIWDNQNEGCDATNLNLKLGQAYSEIQQELLHPNFWQYIKAIWRRYLFFRRNNAI